jgi:hypothetical protein
MNIDWFFTMGKAHSICEDYAIDGEKAVIVSDGCSSSKHTDLGSRLLAHSARLMLDRGHTHNEFGKSVVVQAGKLLDTIYMGHECLYATLIVAKVLASNNILVRMYGDGIIIAISYEQIETIEVNFTNNMPYYLAYLLDKESLEAYKKYNNEMTITRTVNGEVIEVTTAAYDHPLDYTFNATTVLISSDGLSSFEDSQRRLILPLRDVIPQVVDFKNMKGEFVKRRLGRMIETLAANKVFPLDDVGVAGIHL